MSYFAGMDSPFDAEKYSSSNPAGLNSQNGKESPRKTNELGRSRRGLSMSGSMQMLSDTRHELSKISALLSPGLKLPRLSPDTTERVFPIRSVVSLDSPSLSSQQSPPLEKAECLFSPPTESFRGFPRTDEGELSQPPLPLGGVNPACLRDWSYNKSTNRSQRSDAENESSVFMRRMSKHGLYLPDIPTIGTLNNTVPTGREGPQNISNSLDDMQAASSKIGQTVVQNEGIVNPKHPKTHTLDDFRTIQSFGALVVLQELEGKAFVQIASKNSEEIIGYAPTKLFKLDSLCDILQEQQKSEFISHIVHMKSSPCNIERNGPDVLQLTVVMPEGSIKEVWCTMHATAEGNIVCELEPARNPADDPETPKETYYRDPMAESHESDEVFAKKTLRRFSQNPTRLNHATEAFNSMSQILQMTATAQSITELLDRIVVIVEHLTGFGRVAVHRFDEDWNSAVVAESVNSEVEKSLGSYKDVYFPASTLPEQLRSLHSKNKVHLSYSLDNPQTDLAYRMSEDQSTQLDPTYTYLSTASSKISSPTPTYTSMSISINVFGNLWGLIYCQSHCKNARLAPPIHKLCWFVSETVSRNLERLACTSPCQMQDLAEQPREDASIQNAVAFGKGILGLFGADYAVSSISGETKILGKPSDSQEVLAFLEYLRMRQADTVLWSTDVSKDFQDLSYPPGFRYISGFLYIPLLAGGRDFIALFKNLQLKDINWAASPLEEQYGNIRHKPGLRVRKETTLCKPDGWSARDVENASAISLVYRSFTEIWQHKEVAMQGTQLTKLLLANCAHEFRTPLNAIINYLEIALDGSLNQETRENLSRSHSASKSLIYIINDLLDLTNAENGQNLIKDEVFNFTETLRGATKIFAEEAKQKHVNLFIVQHSRLPPVLGDQRRVRQVLMNMISNAVQHTSSGAVTVESSILPEQGESKHIDVEVAIHDTGSGMSQETVDALFCELEQVSNKDYLQNSRTTQNKTASGKEEPRAVLGLGLALVARIVLNMNGQLSVKSEKGTGSCFRIRLRFPLPVDELQSPSTQESSLPEIIPIAETTETTPRYKDEMSDRENQGEQTNVCELDFTTNEGEKTGIAVQNEQRDITSTLTADTKRFTLETAHSQDPETPDRTKRPESPSQGQSNNFEVPLSHSTVLKKDPTEKSPTIAPKEPDTNHQETRTNPPEQGSGQKANVPTIPETQNATRTASLHVLVAEDDPINSKIVKKRLEKSGHTVHMTVNGKECASAYRENPESFDAVLMDIQVRPSSKKSKRT